MNNQFLYDYIVANDNSVKEHQMLSFIKKEHAQFFDALGDSPSLFKQHFYLFHQLYLLANELNQKNIGLQVSAIEISSYAIDVNSDHIGYSDPLKQFYLDEKNLELPDEDIQLMLNQFWEKYLAIDKKAEAINELELQNVELLDIETVKKQFNRLAKKHHPDKGGCKQRFIKIRSAYDTLKLVL